MLERYKLFLSWARVEYKDDNTAVLVNAEFTGPVIREVAEMRSNDSIRLDLSLQYIEALGSWSIATLSWGNVIEQTQTKIRLGDCVITSDELTKAKFLSSVDCILIDTEAHEESKHQYNLVYKATIVNKENGRYSL